jgi:aspartate-semialdehyde dehydrogenase
MEHGLRVAVVGATGVVGRNIILILEERFFPVKKLHVVASSKSAGSTLLFQDLPHVVEDLSDFDFSQVDLCFFSAGGHISEKYAPIAVAAGVTVIDNSSFFRYQDDIPLVVPEVNGHILATTKSKLIANPNCSTAQLVVALKPFYDHVGIDTVDVATYQSVSGAGREAIDTLARESAAILSNDLLPEGVFAKQIAFNVLPHIDEFGDNGYTREEMKMVWETKKIFADDAIKVNPTAVRVPVFFGHSEAVHVRTKKAVDLNMARKWLRDQAGLTFVDDLDYPTAVTHAASKDPVFVGRLRQNLGNECGVNMWVVADNIRKGAALNAIQIAEVLFGVKKKFEF